MSSVTSKHKLCAYAWIAVAVALACSVTAICWSGRSIGEVFFIDGTICFFGGYAMSCIAAEQAPKCLCQS